MRIDPGARLSRRSPEPRADGREAEQAARNRRTRAAVARLAPVHRAALRARESSEEEHQGLRRRYYTFDHPRREGIRAVALSPDTAGPWPAVLVCPGRNARLEAVTGLSAPDHPDRDVAVHLARAGYLTLTLDHGLARGDSAARPDGRDPAIVLDGELRLHGDSVLALLADTAVAALTWLAGRPDVEPERIGLFGHSLGAAVALHAALLYEEPVPVCAASHLGGYPTMFGRLATWDQFAALPSILRYADLPDLYSALAPAPLQIQYGRNDHLLDPADAAAAGNRVQDGYSAVGAGTAVEVLPVDMGHGTAIDQAAAFFSRSLAAPVRVRAEVPAARVGFDAEAREEITDLVDNALASGTLTLGPVGARLEELARQRIGRGSAAVSSGSAALEIALRVIGVAGRTVLVPVNTFFATAAGAIRAGARIDAVDMELDGLGMDPGALRAALAEHDDVAAVVLVHIAGVVSPALTEVLAECAARGIPVVEDAAHALGSALDGTNAGAFGRLAAFSLYPTKVITSGEGGLVTADADDLDLVRRLRDHGKRSFEENVHAFLGSNWRMSELHAAVGATHLPRLDAVLEERRRLAAGYDARLADVPALTPYAVPPGVRGNYYKYVAYLPDGVDRSALKQRLRKRGVALAGEVYDTLLNQQPFFADAFPGRVFGNAEWFAARHVCLPLFPGMAEREQELVVDALQSELS